MEERLEVLEHRLEALEERLEALEHRVEKSEERFEKLEGQVDSLEGGMCEVSKNIIHLKLQNENVILPRLQTIEECYTSTYLRYRDGIVHMDQLQADVSALKTVVSDHSYKLQNIS